MSWRRKLPSSALSQGKEAMSNMMKSLNSVPIAAAKASATLEVSQASFPRSRAKASMPFDEASEMASESENE